MLYLIGVFLSLLATQVTTETCSAPSGDAAECIPMGECPGLTDIFANYANGTEELLSQFFCKNRYVCCPSHWNSALYNSKLARKTYCGLQHTDDYVRPTSDISPDEFPWLAAIISTNLINYEEVISCQGTLINNRYVITAAHCTSNRKYRITRIRLGEFNIKNGTDCLESQHAEDCSTTEEFGIEEIITHHFYSSETGQNDVALIRINKSAIYTDFVRPICLPTLDMTSVRPGDTLYATGWGKTTTAQQSDIKKKIRTTLITNKECQDTLNEFKTTIVISSYNMCTIDEEDSKDFSCAGDGGGPVMFSYRSQWYLEGIISAGIGCGRKIPDVQTKAIRYLSWIKLNLRS